MLATQKRGSITERGTRPAVLTPRGRLAVPLVLNEIERAVVGKRDALALVLLGLLADGNVLI